MTEESGTISSIHARGFGFLELDDKRVAFVTPPDLNPFLVGDRVRAKITTAHDGRHTASAITLTERFRVELFGQVVRRGGKTFLRVDRSVANTDWRLDGADGVEDGASVLARIEGQGAHFDRVVPTAEIGLERLRVRHGLRSGYPSYEPPAAWTREGRRDLRAIPTVTIDGPTSRDLDDAVAAIPAGKDGGLRVLISIADVDALVPVGSPLDVEARARATSVYLAGQVLNMLPPALSEDALSLLPDVERPTMTVELRLDPEGEVTSIDIYPSITKTVARLTYGEVSAFLDRGEAGAMAPEVLTALQWLRTASSRLGAVRAARGGIELLREEAHITLDSAGEPTAIDARADGSSNVMIERLMVAANEAVARWLVERGLPATFRVHDEPSAEAVKDLEQSAAHFGFVLGLAGRLTPRGLAALQAQFATSAVAPAMRTVLQRVLGPARYTVAPGPHFGLSAPLYLHFTSPIRRYADVVVHRVVKGYLAGDRAFEAGDPAIEELARHLNVQAYRATKAEAERQRMLAARLFASRIGERFAGNVVAVKPFGLVVQLVGLGVTGTVATEALPEDGGPYVIERHALVGGARRYSVGDALEVVVVGTSEELGRIELAV